MASLGLMGRIYSSLYTGSFLTEGNKYINSPELLSVFGSQEREREREREGEEEGGREKKDKENGFPYSRRRVILYSLTFHHKERWGGRCRKGSRDRGEGLDMVIL